MHIIPKDKRQMYAKQMLENELFPHLGTTTSSSTKALFLGFMVNKLIATHEKKRPEDDRDHTSTKRLETSGTLIGDIFRSLYKRNNNLIRQYITKRQDILSAINRTNQITNGLRHCFATGNWGVQKNAYIRTGVAQVLSRLTWGATISHIRRLVIPIGKEGKNTKIRQLHSSQWGYICPSETPEGQSSGIVKNFANFSNVSTRTPTLLLKTVLNKVERVISISDVADRVLENRLQPGFYKLLLNGIWMGITYEPQAVQNTLINKRIKGSIPNTVSISSNDIDREINIYGDEGRMIRPVFKINKMGKLLVDETEKLTWQQLIKRQHILYIDTYEADNKVIATFPSDLKSAKYGYRFDYCEIHPSCILGTMAGMIPYPDRSEERR